MGVTQGEGGVVVADTVFTGAQKEEESNTNNVGERSLRWRRGPRAGVGQSEQIENKGYGCRFNTCWWRILFVPPGGEAAEAKVDVAGQCLARVVGPHPLERLTNRAEDVLNIFSCDGPLAWGQTSIPISLGE